MSQHTALGPKGLPIVQGIELVSIRDILPDSMRTLFPYPFFNAMQSKCIPSTYECDDNFVLSSPTGSGKTVILELAICRLLLQQINHHQPCKIVYQAPTKALCSERCHDWGRKFSSLGLHVEELTGDTESTSLKHVQAADIIITTPEKWDSVTRKWKDHRKLMELIRLFLIDEVHILKEDRGAILEAIVSRMKSTGSNVRFVALSATVPNADDIAKWLGRNMHMQHLPAASQVFGEEFRPVRLQKHVIGLSSGGSNEFQFDMLCTQRLPSIITTYAQAKPILVFCFTRKSTETTATQLASWGQKSNANQRLWPNTTALKGISDPVLQGTLAYCVIAGVAYHHAGVSQSDRHLIETAYREGHIGVICCTTTLAIGINMPCHLAIIKNTVSYQQEGGINEYSDLEIMQMMGRAGRPQYDTNAIALILTRQEKVSRYVMMTAGQQIIESRLHLNLIDHLNAELSLGTIQDLQSAKRWLSGTFLFVRLTKNPQHYHVIGDEPSRNLNERAEQICRKGLDSLLECGLIEGGSALKSTNTGQAMSKYCVAFDSMKLFLGIQQKAKLSEILSAIAQAHELKSVRFRAGDKGLFKDINRSPMIRFPIKVDLALSAHRVSLIIQATLGGIDVKTYKDFSPHMSQYFADQALIFQHVHRFIRCIIECQVSFEDSISTRNSLELERSFEARAWDDSPMQMAQIEGLGLVGVRKLASANITNLEELEITEAYKIEMALSRNPPFGANILNKLKDLPKLRVSLRKIGQPVLNPGHGVTLNLNAEVGFLNEKLPLTWKKKSLNISFLSETSDGNMLNFTRIRAVSIGQGVDLKFTARLTKVDQTVNCYVSFDELAGSLKYASLTPKLSPDLFIQAKAASSHSSIDTNPKCRSTKSSIPLKRSRPYDEDDNMLKDDYDDLDDSELIRATQSHDFDDIDDVLDDHSLSLQFPSVSASLNRKPTNVFSVANEISANTTPASKSISTEPAQPIRLQNGKFACHHKCKNKDTCRHVCCNEGLDKPPRPRKFDSATDLNADSGKTAAQANNRPRSTTKNTPSSLHNYPGFEKRAKQSAQEPQSQNQILISSEEGLAARANIQKKRTSSSNITPLAQPQQQSRSIHQTLPFLLSSSSPVRGAASSSVKKGIFVSSSNGSSSPIKDVEALEKVDLSTSESAFEPSFNIGRSAAAVPPRSLNGQRGDRDEDERVVAGRLDVWTNTGESRNARAVGCKDESASATAGGSSCTANRLSLRDITAKNSGSSNIRAGNSGSENEKADTDDQSKEDIDALIMAEFGDFVDFV